jgi:hypothetical protein
MYLWIPLQYVLPKSAFSHLLILNNKLPACVMNFISFNAAYSLYPRATFEERRSLSFSVLTESDIRCLAKYSVRGWLTLSDLWPHDAAAQTTFYMDRERWVTDSFSWIVPLDTTGVEPRPCISPVSQPFSWDPIEYNSWVLIKPEKKDTMYLSYHILRPTPFRYTYLFANRKVTESLAVFLRRQGRLEHKKTAMIPDDKKESSWTWCSSYNVFAPNLRTNDMAGGMQFYLNTLLKFALKKMPWTLRDFIVLLEDCRFESSSFSVTITAWNKTAALRKNNQENRKTMVNSPKCFLILSTLSSARLPLLLPRSAILMADAYTLLFPFLRAGRENISGQRARGHVSVKLDKYKCAVIPA